MINCKDYKFSQIQPNSLRHEYTNMRIAYDFSCRSVDLEDYLVETFLKITADMR